MQMRMKARSPNEDASRFGFGIDVMKETKVCKQCGAATVAEKHVCSHCGAKLPQESLFQFYQRMHRLCPLCDTVLSAQHLLIDGNRFKKYQDLPHTTVIKGDGKYLSIAACLLYTSRCV